MDRARWVLAALVPALFIFGMDLVYEPEYVEPGAGAARYDGVTIPLLVLPGAIGLAAALFGLILLPRILAASEEMHSDFDSWTPIGRALPQRLSAWLGALAAALILAFLSAALLGELNPPHHAGLIALGIAFSLLTTFGLGALIGSVARSSKAAALIGNAVLWPLVFVAGIFAYPPLMSDTMQRVAGFTPVGAGVQLLQYGWFGRGLPGAPGPVLLLVVSATWAVAAWGLALLIGSRVEATIRRVRIALIRRKDGRMDLFVALPIAVILIIAVTALAPKTGVAAPLILVLLGILISFLPGFPGIDVEPELVLAGMLPPLLYSTAVALPVMDFRRDFAAISLLSVLLVLISAVVLGFVFRALIPDLGLAGGIALGAIVSPTDAVATSIAKGLGAPSRVITVLEGEGLINDATSMVLLRTAIAATAATVSLGGFAATFAWAVVGAVICGFAAGTIGLLVRRRIVNPALTAVSFVVPFAAFLLAEEMGASGLVAAVVAGLVTSYGSAKYLSPQDRFFEHANWRTVEHLVEGLLFLMMGLQLAPTIREVLESHDNLRLAVFVAVLALILVPLIRSCFIAPMLWQLHRVAMSVASRRGHMERIQSQVDARIANAGDDGIVTFGPHGPSGRTREVHVSHAHDFRTRLVRRISDVDYMISKPLGPREGVLLVWAGMRGVVTLAAAKSLPRVFPHRPLVVLIAFFVAAGSLLFQGGTLPYVVRRLGLANQHSDDPEGVRELREVMETSALELLTSPDLRRPDGSRYDEAVVRRVLSEMDSVTNQLDTAQNPRAVEQAEQYNELRVRTLNRQRAALLEVRSHGTQDSEQLASVLDAIDVQQIALEIHDV